MSDIKAPFFIPGYLLNQPGQKVEDLEFSWILSQAKSMGYEEVTLPPIAPLSPLFDYANKEVLRHQLKPVHHISSDEFSFEEIVGTSLSQGVHFVVMIYKPLTPAFLHQNELLDKYRRQIKFVLIARKDWNFVDTFKSIPHSMREHLFIDFPARVQQGDPFYSPYEIKKIISELGKSFNNFNFKSYNPHFQFYCESQQLKIKAVTCPRKLTANIPKISIITTHPDVVSKLSKIATITNNASQYEVIVARFTDQKTKVIQPIKGLLTSKIWLHCDEAAELEEQGLAQLRNYAATYASGEKIIFCEESDIENLELLLEDASFGEEKKICASEGSLLFQRKEFLESGGFDPLYSSLGMGKIELGYKYLKLRGIHWENQLQYLVEEMNSVSDLQKKIGARLFYNQYFDLYFYKNLFQFKEKVTLSPSQSEKQVISPQLKYRLIRIKDAYLSLYKATPKVAIEGNLKFIWSFLQPYLNKAYSILHRFYYDYIHKGYYLFYRFHRHIYFDYIHRGYYKYVFRALFPIRKIYYILEYQYEKRVLGLHEKKSQFNKAKT